MALIDEIQEQPAVLSRLLETQGPVVESVAAELRQRPIDYVFLAARGSSDHAGLYAKYLWGIFNRLPIALAAPSILSLYGRAPRFERALILAISQSGQSPDIVQVVDEGRRQSVPTLAITNDPGSPLGARAEFVIDIGAGPERAIAATKTYTAQLLAVALLSVALEGDPRRAKLLRAVPGWVSRCLELEDRIRGVAERYRYADHCVVLGRGFNFATAHEWALKLKELAYVLASPYSSADFRHGPIAIVAQGFPVFAVATRGAVHDEMVELLTRLRSEQRAELLVFSDSDHAREVGNVSVPLPAGVPEWLTPLMAIVPAQLFSYHLTRAKGLDPDAPRGLTKITRSW